MGGYGRSPERRIPRRGLRGGGIFRTPPAPLSACAAPELQGSGSEKRRPGHPRSPTLAQSTPRAETFLESDTLSHRGRFFSWTVHGPFSFWGAKKTMGGGMLPASRLPAGKAGVVSAPSDWKSGKRDHSPGLSLQGLQAPVQAGDDGPAAGVGPDKFHRRLDLGQHTPHAELALRRVLGGLC